MSDRQQHFLLEDPLVMEHAVVVMHRSAHHAELVEELENLLAAALQDRRRDVGQERGLILGSKVAIPELRISAHLVQGPHAL